MVRLRSNTSIKDWNETNPTKTKIILEMIEEKGIKNNGEKKEKGNANE